MRDGARLPRGRTTPPLSPRPLACLVLLAPLLHRAGSSLPKPVLGWGPGAQRAL